MSKLQFDPIEDLIADIRQGKMVLLVDDEDRENEGDLVLAADHVTSEAINFMAKEARGLICLSLSAPQVERLKIPLMVRDEMNFSPNKTAFTVSIEAAAGVSTGISAADRAHTIRVAANPQAKPSDIHVPGHIFPIRAQAGGVLKRAGHTEGSVDLAILAGLNPAAVICEVMNPDGTMARAQELQKFAKEHGIKIGTIVDLIEYRLSHETLVEEVGHFAWDYMGKDFSIKIFKSKVDGLEHLVIQKGQIRAEEAPLVRVQVQPPFSDTLSILQNKKSQLQNTLESVSKESSAVIVVLNTLTIGQRSLLTELQSLTQDQPAPKADSRDYGIGAQILRHLGVRKLRLLTSQPDHRDRYIGLKGFDLEICEVVSFNNFANKS